MTQPPRQPIGPLPPPLARPLPPGPVAGPRPGRHAGPSWRGDQGRPGAGAPGGWPAQPLPGPAGGPHRAGAAQQPTPGPPLPDPRRTGPWGADPNRPGHQPPGPHQGVRPPAAGWGPYPGPPRGSFPGPHPLSPTGPRAHPHSTLPPWLAGHPGYPAPARPRAGANTGPLLATVLVAVLVVTVGMIGVLAMGDRGESVADVGYDEPTAPGAESRPAATDEAPADSGDRPTADRTPTGTTDSPTGPSPRDTPTRDTPTQDTPAAPRPVPTLGDNPLFAGENGAPAVTCQLTRWETTPQGAAAFFTSALPCLDAAWEPVLRRAGLPFFRPAVEFPEGTTWSSPCGSVAGGGGAVAAFYCGENNTLYMPFAGLQTDEYGAHPGVYLAVLAHEYGHHVQAMSGVLDAYATARYEAGADTEPGLELSRRLELQAQCFSGMFFAAAHARGSVDDTILAEARASQNRGDHSPGKPRDHGTDAHASAWWEQGTQKNRTFQCNTWLSPAADVA